MSGSETKPWNLTPEAKRTEAQAEQKMRALHNHIVKCQAPPRTGRASGVAAARNVQTHSNRNVPWIISDKHTQTATFRASCCVYTLNTQRFAQDAQAELTQREIDAMEARLLFLKRQRDWHRAQVASPM